MFLTPEELMAGGDIKYDIDIPEDILNPNHGDQPHIQNSGKKIKLRPLTVKDIQLIAKAAKNDEVLTSILMIQKAVVEPQLKQSYISKMHSGLVRFLVDHINRISGLRTTEDELREFSMSPIIQAFFVMAKEFNWTPDQVKEMTIGQILGYLEMLNQAKQGA